CSRGSPGYAYGHGYFDYW
nr:immunoglobulin heavy chain junction region [Macaca mulatta]